MRAASESLERLGREPKNIRLDSEATRFVVELQFDWWIASSYRAFASGAHRAEFIQATKMLNSGKFAEREVDMESIPHQ
jgi:hypothetical protein